MGYDAQRRSLLLAALGFALLEPPARELRLLNSWLSTGTGIGHIIVGMHRQGYDVQLTQYDERSAALHGSNLTQELCSSHGTYRSADRE